jgi:1-acyl-sn-glycerol-3-phosphate acyltransferase
LPTAPIGGTSNIAIDYLRNGKVVGLFPEGGCSRDGRLRTFKTGVALLAFKTGRPIIPCAIQGSHQALPIRASFPKLFVPIKVKIGKPKYLLREPGDVIDDLYLEEGLFEIKNSIQEMLNAG